jgi:peptidoglycan/xylan/chitin deacetylase (PgdA/CDA1 family)
VILSVIKNSVKGIVPRRLCITHLKPDAGNTILLTFDDGPHPKATPAILDRLSKFDAKAIFFVVGNRIRRAPELLSRVLEEGHWLKLCRAGGLYS